MSSGEKRRSQSRTSQRHVALVGAGPWGVNLARNLHTLGALGLVCDQDPGVLERLGSTYDGLRRTRVFEDVLRDDRMQAVVVATPAIAHASMVREALEAGKDVLVEKPLALSEQEGVELIELAHRHGRILMVGHLLWYHPAILKLKELIDGGELGRLQYIYSQRLNLGRIRREENILWSFAPHDISIILGLIGGMPERVQAQGGYYFRQHVADVTVTCLAFRNGVCAHIFVSWLHPYKEQRLVVVGDRKMAVFNDLEAPELKLLLYPHIIEWRDNMPVPTHKEAERVPFEPIEPLRAECEHFLECVRRRQQPRTDGHEALRVLKVLGWCEEALEQERRQAAAEASPVSQPSDGDRVYLHPTAVVDQGAQIEAGSKVWHFSHVMAGARIGKRCTLGQNVFIGRNVVVGDDVKVQNNVSIYEGVTLEDKVFCGPSVVFTNVINPRSAIDRKREFQATRIREGATLGANCTVLCGHTVGRYALIGAGAVVTTDVPDFALVTGVPGRVSGWVCRCGERLGAARLVNGGARRLPCRSCGTRYEQRNGFLRELVGGSREATGARR